MDFAGVEVAFVDVGGTLWPDRCSTREHDRDERIVRLRGAVPELSGEQASELVDSLSSIEHPRSDRQLTNRLVEEALLRCDLIEVVSRDSVVAAMCLPAAGRAELLPGAAHLVVKLATLAKVVIVSNTLWRRSRAIERDFEELGVARHVTDYVMSIDVGWRKPHRRFFDAALGVGGAAPERCVIIGDSETNDVEPGRARGMAAVRVAIEEPVPSMSTANHICSSLDQVATLLCR